MRRSALILALALTAGAAAFTAGLARCPRPAAGRCRAAPRMQVSGFPDDELPEDRFHKSDATSQYHIGQRESAVQDKWDKHAADKKEREENPDPNVEYVDMDEYKPGGKRGPELSKAAAKVVQQAEEQQGDEQEDLQRAAELVAAMAPKNAAVEGLSSNLWAELI